MTTLRSRVLKISKLLALAGVGCLEAAIVVYIVLKLQSPAGVQGSLSLLNSIIAFSQLIGGIWLMRKCKNKSGSNDPGPGDAGVQLSGIIVSDALPRPDPVWMSALAQRDPAEPRQELLRLARLSAPAQCDPASSGECQPGLDDWMWRRQMTQCSTDSSSSIE